MASEHETHLFSVGILYLCEVGAFKHPDGIFDGPAGK